VGDEHLPLVPDPSRPILDPRRGAPEVQGARVLLRDLPGLRPVAHIQEEGAQRGVGLGVAPLQLPDESIGTFPIAGGQGLPNRGKVLESLRIHARIHRAPAPQRRVIQVDAFGGHAAEDGGPDPAIPQEKGLLEVFRGLRVAKLMAGRVGADTCRQENSGDHRVHGPPIVLFEAGLRLPDS